MSTASNTPTPLNLISIEKDGVVRVATGGDLTANNTTGVGQNPLERVLGPGWPTNRVLLDLSHTGYVDSPAIGWLLSSAKQFRERGGVVVLHSVAPRVKQILELLRVGKVVPVAADEAAARAMLATQTTQTAEAK